MTMPSLDRRFIGFLVAGGINTLFGYSVYGAQVLMGIAPHVAVTVSTLAGILFNFLTTSAVFRSRDLRRLPRFLIVYSFMLSLNILLLELAMRAGLGPLLAQALVLPIFLELDAMHLIGRSLSVILPFAFFPFGVYVAYIYYVTALPPELLDAARVDGASELQTFLRVALPLAKPVVALVFFFSFVADWNNFFLPYVVLADSDQYPITVGLSNLLASTPSFNPAVGGGGQSVNIFKPELALATLLAVVPIAIVFVFSQRALVRGLVGGAVKE